MIEFIKKARSEGDSVGGIVRCRIEGLPVGLGDPVFDRFEAELAKAMLSMPATKGFEIGAGFAATRMFGSQHNDAFCLDENGKVSVASNRAGGVLGGITSGAPLISGWHSSPPQQLPKSRTPSRASSSPQR